MIMNWKLLLVLAVCLCLLVDAVSAQKRRKGRKMRRLKKIRQMELEKLQEAVKEAEKLKEEIEHDMELDNEVEDDDKVPLADEDEAEEETEEEGDNEEENDALQELNNDETDQEVEQEVPYQSPLLIDPCENHYCSAGKECIVTPEWKAECRCIESCTIETDPRRKTCSNHNETWDGDCLVHQMRCWCHEGDERCADDKYKHLHIEYYGECSDVNDCKEEEMAEFPERMREWLFNVMREMAERRALSEHYLQLEKESEDLDSDNNEKWVNAVIWKWCDLDGHPRDKKVSRHELFPIRAPLLILEHCIAPFLDSCDKDDDHYISLSEWGDCLKLPKDVLEDKCEQLTGDSSD